MKSKGWKMMTGWKPNWQRLKSKLEVNEEEKTMSEVIPILLITVCFPYGSCFTT